MRNALYFMLKAWFVLEIFTFLSWFFRDFNWQNCIRHDSKPLKHLTTIHHFCSIRCSYGNTWENVTKTGYVKGEEKRTYGIARITYFSLTYWNYMLKFILNYQRIHRHRHLVHWLFTVWKVSKYAVFLGPYFPVPVRIQEITDQKKLRMDTFHAVILRLYHCPLGVIIKFITWAFLLFLSFSQWD